MNVPVSILKEQMLVKYIQINNLKIKGSIDLEHMLQSNLDFMFNFSENYNINPYLMVQDSTTNMQKTHIMTHILVENICENIVNLDK